MVECWISNNNLHMDYYSGWK